MNKPNSLPSQQIEEIVKRLKDQYALFVRRDTHGVEEELYPVDIAKVLKQELEACMESARKEALKDLRFKINAHFYNNDNALMSAGFIKKLLDALSQPKECECQCHYLPHPLTKCSHCQPKGEDK